MGTHPIFESDFDCLTVEIVARKAMKVRDAGLERCRTDLHLTSTGKCHYYEGTKPFPPANFERSHHNALPPPLSRDHLVNCDQMETTNGFYHERKSQSAPLRNVMYKRAPGSSYVKYMKHNLEYLNKEHNRNFTMGDRFSEMTSQYKHKVTPRDTALPSYRGLELHATGGPSSTPFATPDNRLITHIHPYLSTTNKHHRPFTTSEQARLYPAKDALTFWEMEGYPKVWGHGSSHGKNIPPRKRHDATQVMTDANLGGNEVKSQVHRIPARAGFPPVPNMGLKSLVRSSYIRHAGPGLLNLAGIEPPMPNELDFNHGRRRNGDTANCPTMYTTEYQHYGGENAVRV